MSSNASIRASEPASRVAERYTIERPLGQGGTGAVYAALDTATGKRVAVKRLIAQVPSKLFALFEREYRTLASLRHPRIVEVYEYGSDSGGPYYTMELLEGQDLSKLAPMPWREVCRCLRDVASILGVLHARSLIHRDLSPKNLWRLPDGRLKLIDFGSLANFGVARELIGTPPFVAPEALHSAALDQRYDLYALGALGYWLLTGVHARPVRTLADLPRLLAQDVVPPSQQLALAEGATIERPPAELEELLLALLKIRPAERPTSTGELIDRLHLLAELPPEADDAAAAGYLQSKVFVGRTQPCDRFNEQLGEACEGRGRALLIEGAAGMGCSRLLQELSLSARIAGAATLVADSGSNDRAYGTAIDLALKLLACLPEQAQRAAEPYRALLGSLSPELRERLSAPAFQAISAEDTRARAQHALRDWFLAVSDGDVVALFVDDMHVLDVESQALLAALAHDSANRKLMIVATVRSDGGEPSVAVSSYRNAAAHERLVPLSAAETRAMLGSIFGGARYLERLAERLHRLSEGNPAYCLELAEHLVRSGVIRYKDGLWELPNELSSAQLPSTREQGLAARLARLSPARGSLARRLSVPHHGRWTRAMCLAVATTDPLVTGQLLDELVAEGILEHVAAGYSFVHELLRAQLYGELPEASRLEVHQRVGEALLAELREEPFALLCACLHLLRAGDSRGVLLLRRAEVHYWETNSFSSLQLTAPLFEEALALRRASGADAHSLSGPLTMLAVAGYFVDRRYAARYGSEAVSTLEAVLHLSLARSLGGVFGKKFALVLSLLLAALSLRLFHRAAQLSVKHSVRMLLASAAALCGTAAICFDAEAGRRCTRTLEPFAVLGEDHIAGFLYDFSRVMGTQAHKPGSATALAHHLIARLESERPIRELVPQARASYLAALSYAQGVRECWRDSPEALHIAERLENRGPLYAMSADHLRASYYAGRGDMAKAERFRQRLEVHAVHMGSAWQVETWSPCEALFQAVRTEDALSAKRAAQEFARIAAEVPSLRDLERMARAAYMVLRGKYRNAIDLLAAPPIPVDVAAWSLGRGLLARAHNALGDHAKALDVCREALAHLTEDDLSFGLNLTLQIELALAEAGLGDAATARARLDRLLTLHAASENPLTMSALHLAYASFALCTGDLANCREHVARTEEWIESTEAQGLTERAEALRKQLCAAESPRAVAEGSRGLSAAEQRLFDRVRLVLARSGRSTEDRAQTVLKIGLELSGAEEGFVLWPGQGVLAHSAVSAPEPEIVSWAEKRLVSSGADEETALLTAAADDNLKLHAGKSYCASPLIVRRNLTEVVVGLLVLGFDRSAPRLLATSMSCAFASHLLDGGVDKSSSLQSAT